MIVSKLFGVDDIRDPNPIAPMPTTINQLKQDLQLDDQQTQALILLHGNLKRTLKSIQIPSLNSHDLSKLRTRLKTIDVKYSKPDLDSIKAYAQEVRQILCQSSSLSLSLSHHLSLIKLIQTSYFISQTLTLICSTR